MMNQTVFDTSRIFSLKGVRHVVLSPGSRNAPLTLSFARNPDILTYNIVDERSAGFIALGMAQKLHEPVVLCCTSGTSLLNYAPAVAEAYYQQIPLIVISADRPPEWIGQRDGQTIHQLGAIGNFVKEIFQLPTNPVHADEIWEYNRKLNEAINLSCIGTRGPVHLNIPFREPFYPADGQTLEFSGNHQLIGFNDRGANHDFTDLTKAWHQYERKLIIVGQQPFDPLLEQALAKHAKDVVMVADIISNIRLEGTIRHQDLFLAGISTNLIESLKPDLIVTLGRSVISKNLKLFVRNNPPKALWHFDVNGIHVDPYKCMSQIICGSATDFLNQIEPSPDTPQFSQQVSRNFVQNWQVADDRTSRNLYETLDASEFSEFTAFANVMSQIIDGADIHLANSMPVRYANFVQALNPACEVFANRGTSGIDGTNGTAVGHAIVSDQPTYLLTGDLSFFYDRNAFFHHHSFSNLKIIVFNNAGGGIFRLIPGPSQLPELAQHFETRHSHTAKFTALEYGFDYFAVKDMNGLSKAMTTINKDLKTPKLVEIFTDPKVDSKVFKLVKEQVKLS